MDRLVLTFSILYKVLNHLLSLVGEMVLEPTSTADLEGLYVVAGLWPPENSSENIWDKRNKCFVSIRRSPH